MNFERKAIKNLLLFQDVVKMWQRCGKMWQIYGYWEKAVLL